MLCSLGAGSEGCENNARRLGQRPTPLFALPITLPVVRCPFDFLPKTWPLFRCDERVSINARLTLFPGTTAGDSRRPSSATYNNH
ncbi:hypothetical protein VTN77DRAFT_4582 [Rasamsonia byssochlamydoides]|uniref:uncharacterized protein n=1 Tax=Rasamsonia byssochlamydoides TaxID=89139 RepID=UPI0037445100